MASLEDLYKNALGSPTGTTNRKRGASGQGQRDMLKGQGSTAYTGIGRDGRPFNNLPGRVNAINPVNGINTETIAAAPGLPAGEPAYITAYRDSLNKARGNINNNIQAALGAISQGEAAGMEMAGQMPAQYQQAFDQGRTNFLQMAQAADAASNPYMAVQGPTTDVAGTQLSTGATAAATPLIGAMQMATNFAQAGAPMLQAGVAAQGAQRRADVEMQRLAQMAELDSREAELAMRLGAQQDDYAREDALRAQNRLWDLADRDDERAYAAEQGAAAAEADRLNAIDSLLLESGQKFSARDMANVEASKIYKDAVKRLTVPKDTQVGWGPWDWGKSTEKKVESIDKVLEGIEDPLTRMVLEYRYKTQQA